MFSNSLPAARRLGRGGPVVVERKEFRTRVLGGFLRAGRQLGYRAVDPSDPDQVGEYAGPGFISLVLEQ